MENKITINDTLMIKGVACMLLLFHHLFAPQFLFDLFWHSSPEQSFTINFATISNVCVLIFLILSGFGLTKGTENKKISYLRFLYNRYIKLYMSYWYIFIVFGCIIGAFMRTGIKATFFTESTTALQGTLYSIIDFFGLAFAFGTPSLNGTWWYVSATIALYLVFPLLDMAFKKNKYISVTLSFILMTISSFHKPTNFAHYMCIYQFSFVFGMFLAKTTILETIAVNSHKLIKSIIILLGIVIYAFIKIKFNLPVAFNNIFAFLIICITLSALRYLKICNLSLQTIGKHSGNIFYFHTLVITRWIYVYIYI